MFCNKCGAEIVEGAKFCNSCGNEINGAQKKPNNNTIWESISVQVSPSEENSTIEEYEWFGWELKSSQTIDRKSSHLEGGYNAVYSVTESVNYIKLIFKRNKNMANYEQIKELEDTYRNSFTMEEPKKPSVFWILAAAFLGIPALFSILMGQFFSATGLIFAIPLVVIYIKKKKQYEKEYENYISCNEQTQLRKYEALRKLEEIRGIKCAF